MGKEAKKSKQYPPVEEDAQTGIVPDLRACVTLTRQECLDASPLAPSKIPPIAAGNFEAERNRRAFQELLNGKLKTKRCRHCAVVGNWTVHERKGAGGRVVRVNCKSCQMPDRVVVIVAEATSHQPLATREAQP